MGIITFIKGLLDSVRGAFNNDPRYTQNFEWYPGSGGGGDVTKAYVDQQDAALARRIDGNSTDIDDILLHLTTLDTKVDNLDNDKADKENTYTKTETNSLLDNKADKATTLSGYGITDAYKKTEVDTELAKKLDKRTTGVEVYSHSGDTQEAMTVKTTMSTSPTDTNILTEKAVKTYVDGKDPLAWTYVGILGTSSGSTLTVKDDWKEILIVGSIKEGSSAYNLVQVIPKEGFTQGSPTANVAMFGFYWNDSYKATVRIGINGTGDSRQILVGYSNTVGWSFNGFYIYKR